MATTPRTKATTAPGRPTTARKPVPPTPGAVSRPARPRRDIFESVWNLFCSVRFAVVLILLLAAATTLGTILPQVSPGLRNFPQDYADFMSRANVRFGAATGLMDSVGLFDLYNSFPFRLLIILICYSIIICTLNRWGPTLRLINPQTVRSSEAFLTGLSERAQFSGVPLTPAQAATAVAAALKRSRYRVLRDESNGTEYLYADRDRWSKMVTFVSHAALVLLIITAAGLTQVGWREQSVFMPPNDEIRLGHGTDFTVRQNNFRIEKFAGSDDVKEYWCDVTINKDGKDILTKTIRVNDPLRYDDINFFLVQYQQIAHIQVFDANGQPVVTNAMGENGPITDTIKTAGEPRMMMFAMQDPDGLPMDMVQVRRPGQDTITLQISNYTGTPRADDENPALLVQAFVGKQFDTPVYHDFIPRKGDLTIPALPGLRFAFARDNAVVMEIAQDYGLTPVAFWFVVMTAGFALSLYITFTRCWARIAPVAGDPTRCDITLAGLAEKNKITFETEFERLALRARDALVQATTSPPASPLKGAGSMGSGDSAALVTPGLET